MESLGKREDRAGTVVHQGIAVYGNKGSTDQHAYVQQLRDGRHDFCATFVRELADDGAPLEVEPGVTPGDYLHGLLLGTRAALFENGRESLTLTIPRVDARSVGALIALFERAVGLYASLVGVNAYHQPGVEAGKKAAAGVLTLQARVVAALGPVARDADGLAAAAGAPDSDDDGLICDTGEACGAWPTLGVATPVTVTTADQAGLDFLAGFEASLGVASTGPAPAGGGYRRLVPLKGLGVTP